MWQNGEGLHSASTIVINTLRNFEGKHHRWVVPLSLIIKLSFDNFTYFKKSGYMFGHDIESAIFFISYHLIYEIKNYCGSQNIVFNKWW